MMLNEAVHAWFPVIAGVFSIVATLGLYFIRNETRRLVDASEKRIEKRLDHQHERLAKLEGALETLPSRADFHNLALANRDMAGDLKSMKVKIDGMHETMITTQRSVQRVNDFLLNEKSK